MARHVYNYLGERKIAIDTSSELISRIERNIEEKPELNTNFDCLIKIEEGPYVEIKKDKNFPYLSVRKNITLPLNGFDYFTYDSLIRTIWEKNDHEYLVRTYLRYDEESALKCMRHFYYSQTEYQKNKVLLHASLIEIENRGILIPGKYRSGKTSLIVSLLEKLGAKLVADGNTLVSYDGKVLLGFYLPRVIYIRFSTISNSPRLSCLLSDVSLTETTQLFDYNAIEKIIKSKTFYIDGGLTISRKRLTELLGVDSVPKTVINKIIFPEYSETENLKIKEVESQEALECLKEREFSKNPHPYVGIMKKQYEKKLPKNSILTFDWLKGADLRLISFSKIQDLTKNALEDLLI